MTPGNFVGIKDQIGVFIVTWRGLRYSGIVNTLTGVRLSAVPNDQIRPLGSINYRLKSLEDDSEMNMQFPGVAYPTAIVKNKRSGKQYYVAGFADDSKKRQVRFNPKLWSLVENV